MKKNLLSICVILAGGNGFAQSATTVANGNWTSPLTWNCTCVPVNGYSVTINHTVTLNTSMMFSTGGVNIGNNGALIQDASLNRDILINGGYFNNSGRADFRFFAVASGSASNAGTFTLTAFSNSVSFNNTGLIKMDSMYTAASFTNGTNAQIIGDSITTANTFINNGKVNVTWATNTGTFVNNNYHTDYSFTNSGNYQNYDSLILTYSFWNRLVFSNKPGAKFNITKNFYNNNSGNAVFENNGNVTVSDSWYNTDTIKGSNTGYFSVSDTSANSGVMKGNFMFCDATPPMSSPYVDLNSGTIVPTITYCSPTGLTKKELVAFDFYPNPSNGKIFIRSFASLSYVEVIITDINGRQVYGKIISGNSISELNLNLNTGLYFINFSDQNGKLIKTEKLVLMN